MNMLANCSVRDFELQCAIAISDLSPLLFPYKVNGRLHGPRCNIRFIATDVTNQSRQYCFPFKLAAGIPNGCGMHLLMIFIRDRFVHITIAV